MDKQTFYAQLAEKLSELEVNDNYIAKHLSQFDNLFSGITEEEIENKIAELGSIDQVAARIKRMTDKNVGGKEIKHNNDFSKTSSGIDSSDAEEKNESTGEFSTGSIKNNSEDTISKVEKTDDEPLSVSEPDAEFMEEEIFEKSGIETEDAEVSSLTLPPDEETIRKNKIKFWTVFAVTLPITLSLLFAILFSFAFAFFAIAMLIIVAVGILVAITAAATLTSVFGLIFGVAEAFASLPIGLYECGISVIIGSLAMFIDILVYNFAVRLMPYAAKWLLVFAKYIYKKLKALFIHIKKECIGI